MLCCCVQWYDLQLSIITNSGSTVSPLLRSNAVGFTLRKATNTTIITAEIQPNVTGSDGSPGVWYLIGQILVEKLLFLRLWVRMTSTVAWFTYHQMNLNMMVVVGHSKFGVIRWYGNHLSFRQHKIKSTWSRKLGISASDSIQPLIILQIRQYNCFKLSDRRTFECYNIGALLSQTQIN